MKKYTYVPKQDIKVLTRLEVEEMRLRAIAKATGTGLNPKPQSGK